MGALDHKKMKKSRTTWHVFLDCHFSLIIDDFCIYNTNINGVRVSALKRMGWEMAA